MEMEPPEWIWSFPTRRWVAGSGGQTEGLYETVMQWHQRCREWLEERDLVEWTHSSVTWAEYKRVQREEPHRILRRPDPPAA